MGIEHTKSGLKSQHVASIEWLAKATGADVKGLEIGSETLEFRPRRGPGELCERNIQIRAESPAASALLIFQAVFPFLLFAGNETIEPIELTISGGTNVSFSLSYEYLDQVLLPTLEDRFGVHVERKLQSRGWSLGSASRGLLWFKIQPLSLGSTLKLKTDPLSVLSEDVVIKSVKATIIAPWNMHHELENALSKDLGQYFPDTSLKFEQTEESGHESRIYVFLVAKSQTLRWGRDLLYSKKRKGKTLEALAKDVSTAVTQTLRNEIRQSGTVDEFLQDQLVIFQALAQGQTSFPRISPQAEASQRDDGMISENNDKFNLKVDKVRGPLGNSESDSKHTTTARWVTTKILEPKVKWYNQGMVCEGIGLLSGCGTAWL